MERYKKPKRALVFCPHLTLVLVALPPQPQWRLRASLNLIFNFDNTLVLVLMLSWMLLFTGCSPTDNRPLWGRLEDTQYKSYKPTLDHLEQKYGGLIDLVS